MLKTFRPFTYSGAVGERRFSFWPSGFRLQPFTFHLILRNKPIFFETVTTCKKSCILQVVQNAMYFCDLGEIGEMFIKKALRLLGFPPFT